MSQQAVFERRRRPRKLMRFLPLKSQFVFSCYVRGLKTSETLKID